MPDDAVWTAFKAVLTIGFALWMGVGALNNLVGFPGAAASLARTMAMQPLRDPPAIDTPLAARALASPHWAKAALIGILILQSAAALALAAGGVSLCAGNPGGAALALTGFAVLALLWLGMMIAGLWFGYWIRQEGLQLTHIALLAVTILAAMVVHG